MQHEPEPPSHHENVVQSALSEELKGCFSLVSINQALVIYSWIEERWGDSQATSSWHKGVFMVVTVM